MNPTSAEHQAVMQRRAIALGGAVLFLIVIILLARGCQSSRTERGIKDFVQQTNSILTQSNQSSRDFFNLLKDPGDAGATEIETSVNEQRSLASELVRQASNLSPPGDLTQAKQYLIESLEFRRDGLNAISEQISQALSDQDPEAATEKIAANMQQFLASDVIYSQRAYAYMNQAVKEKDVEGVKLPSSQFLPSLEWLDPAVVDDVLSRARGGTGSDEPVAPGTHGTGITGVSAQPAGTALAEGSVNDLANAKSIAVQVQNQGENDEKDVEVSLQISGSGTPIRLNKPIAAISAGETVTVTIPLTRTPSSGATATLKVEVKRVPGEENTDNNRQEFDVKF
ncbi:MAG: CARDB domain-containing protein [Solirubrobacterales bacterium]